MNESTTAPGANLRGTPGATSGKLVGFLVLVGTVTALNYLANYAGNTRQEDTDKALFRYSTAVGAVIIYGIILAAVLWIAGRPRRPILALRAPRSWPRAIGLAVATLLVAGFVIAIVDSYLHGGREQGVVPKHFLHGHAGAYAANWLVIAGVAPFVEEVTYRGLGYTLFAARWGVPVAIVGTGLLFAASHGLVDALPELAIFGFALAWLRSRLDSVYPGMLVHSAFNSFALASVFWH